MTLPSFLVIGAARAGSTWLHHLLGSHPHVYVPSRRKEIAYFDKLYDVRAADWYAGFFAAADPRQHHAVGEVTPTYLYDPKCPARIRALGSVTHLIAILRNPIDRAYSQYGKMMRDFAYAASFAEALQAHPQLIDRGRYAHHLARFMHEFDRSQLLILSFEAATRDVSAAATALGAFLNVTPGGFRAPEAADARNAGTTPRCGRIYARLQWVNRRLRRHDLDIVSNLARAAGVKRWFTGNAPQPPLSADWRRRLADHFRDDVASLQTEFGVAMPWPEFNEAPTPP